MATVVLHNVTRQFGSKVVLEAVSLEIHSGQTAGLVGANGAGKTTLFRLITGELEPDLGTVTRSKGLGIGFLEQEPLLDSQRTLYEEVATAYAELKAMEEKLHRLSERIAAHHDDPRLPQSMAEYDRLHARFEIGGGHQMEVRINEVLGGLGFTEADRELPISALSGGQKCRAALAKLLLQDQRMLLLDEPTNHLDIDATRWLEKFLAGHHGGAVIISHDRYLLDRLAERIIEVENRGAVSYPGNYTNFVATKERRRLTQARQYAQDQAYIAKERDFIAKHHAAQRGKQARGRLTRLERRLGAGEFVTANPTDRRRAKLGFAKASSGGQMVLRCEEAAKRYGEKVLFADLTFDVTRGQRWGITGANGTGKTTLLRIAMRQVEADTGLVRLYENLRVGYYDQEHGELDRSMTVVESIRQVRPDMLEAAARSYLGRYLFSGDDVFKPIAKCSGGEQSRIRLARLILAEPQVLILDEPTNHLDIASREALEDALLDFDGTVIAVSHDRYFLDRVVEHLLVLAPGQHRLVTGNYSTYVELVEAEKSREAAAATATVRASAVRSARPVRRLRSSKYDRLSIDEIEDLIGESEARITELTDRFADEGLYRDPEASRRLQETLETEREVLAELEDHWYHRIEHA
ncbi:MAG: ABC-F family ATP-binding cassette domain-containing protein [bacterium]|nr:ABC-F family ATP-binding cassette domain-containing protein [bacterium]